MFSWQLPEKRPLQKSNPHSVAVGDRHKESVFGCRCDPILPHLKNVRLKIKTKLLNVYKTIFYTYMYRFSVSHYFSYIFI